MIELRLTEEQALVLRDALQHRRAACATAGRYFPGLAVERGVDLDATIEELESLLAMLPALPDTADVT